MNRKVFLLVVTLGILVLLSGCQPSKSDVISSGSEKNEEDRMPETQAWEDIEWQDVVLQLPETTGKTHYNATFQSSDQTGGLAGLELAVHNWDGTWAGGSCHMEYYEITTDQELATMINVPLADQLIEEYLSQKEHSAYSHENEVMKETIQLGEEPGARIIQESEVCQESDQQLRKTWEYVRDPYNRWYLYFSAQEHCAEDIFSGIHQSIRLKEMPKEIKEGEVVTWGDVEVQIPFTLKQKAANQKFYEKWDELGIEYLYTANSWEGELDGNACVLTYYAVSSDKETLSNYFWPSHMLTYSSNPEHGMSAQKEKAEKITYMDDEYLIVRNGQYPKEIYKSYGYTNEDGRAVCSWQYTQNPYDLWHLEIIAQKEQADALFQMVEQSIRLKDEYQ